MPLALVPRPRCSDALLDFYLAKRATLAAPRTMEFYERTAGEFARWVEVGPEGITARHFRTYLAMVRDRGVSEATVRLHAQGVRTFCRFCMREWGTASFAFDMPRPERKRMRIPTLDELQTLLEACTSHRDRCLILVMADTGARLNEVAALTWDDVDLASGLVHIDRGKGRRARSVVVGIQTRRALIRLKREGELWGGLSRDGIRHVFRRLYKRTGLKFSPHDMRRFFATASLRAGMSPLHVQALLGHSSLEMTRRYIQLVDDDLLKAHAEHGPLDTLAHQQKPVQHL